MRKLLIAVLLLALAGLSLYYYGRAEARRDPVIRTVSIRLPNWPAGIKPVRAVLISDIHIGSPAMDEARLNRIVDQIKALNPDIVLLAGDYISGRDPRGAVKYGEGLVGPLSRLNPPLGVVAVLGNHDHYTGADKVREELARARVTVLENDVTARGPLAIGGVGDAYSKHADLAATLAKLRPFSGARIILTHSPDIAPDLPGDVRLLLAGHTHCGQVALFGWAPAHQPYNPRYRCGLIRDPDHLVVVTAGLGTSGPSVRLGAPPDLWLLTLGP